MKRKIIRGGIAACMAGILLVGSPNIALADSEKVVTLGANLTEQEKASMLQYFGVTEDQVTILEVNNQEEREYLEGIATESQIGTRTYSCAYIMPTNEGIINVRTANLTWVSTNMIANTLVTAGIDSCDVVAAAPRQVSGTGALTGIIKAYESVTEENLDETKTELAMEELLETAELGSEIGQEEASAVMNEVKAQAIKESLTNPEEVIKVVEDVAEHYSVEVTEEQKEQISDLMANIAQQDYDYSKISATMEDLQDKLVSDMEGIKESFQDATEGSGGFFATIGDFFAGIINGIVEFFSNLFGDSKESILDNVDDSALGITPTQESEETPNNTTIPVESEDTLELETNTKEQEGNTKEENMQETQAPAEEIIETKAPEATLDIPEVNNNTENQTQEEMITDENIINEQNENSEDNSVG